MSDTVAAAMIECLFIAGMVLFLLWRDAVQDAAYWRDEMERYREQADSFRRRFPPKGGSSSAPPKWLQSRGRSDR